MLTLNVLIFILAIAPSLISAEPPLFPPDSGVTMLNYILFEKVKKETVSCVCFFFEAGVDTIISQILVWLYSLLRLKLVAM
jgi:hypothetical protein